MKKVMRTSAGLVSVVCLLLVGVGAKPASDTFGLSKGNHTYEVAANVWNSMRFWNTAGTGHISKVELLVDDPNPTGVVRLGVYSSTPCILMQDLGYVPVVDGWVSVEGLNIPVTAGTDYIFSFDLQSPSGIRAQKKGDTLQYSAPYPYDALLLRAGSASDAPPWGTYSNVQYVIRVTVSP